jgi:hypothetical protein
VQPLPLPLLPQVGRLAWAHRYACTMHSLLVLALPACRPLPCPASGCAGLFALVNTLGVVPLLRKAFPRRPLPPICLANVLPTSLRSFTKSHRHVCSGMPVCEAWHYLQMWDADAPLKPRGFDSAAALRVSGVAGGCSRARRHDSSASLLQQAGVICWPVLCPAAA